MRPPCFFRLTYLRTKSSGVCEAQARRHATATHPPPLDSAVTTIYMTVHEPLQKQAKDAAVQDCRGYDERQKERKQELFWF